MKSTSGIKRFIRDCVIWLTVFLNAAGTTAATALSEPDEGTAGVIGQVRTDVLLVREYAGQLLEQNRMADYSRGGFTWDAEKRTTSWHYYNGFMIDALLRLDREEALPLAEGFFRDALLPDGSVAGYTEGSLDSVEPVRPLWALLSGPEKTGAYPETIRWVYSRLESQRFYPACGNNFLHVQDEKGKPAGHFRKYPVLLDSLYMAQPFLAECAAAIRKGELHLTDEKGREVSAETLEEQIVGRYAWIQSYMYDSEKKLYQHGWDPVSSKGNGHYWGRGIGWLAMSLADVIGILPESPARSRMEGILIQLLDGMLLYQDGITSMWYNVVDRGPDLENNRTETSVTAMMAYTLVKVWNDGYAPGDHYLEKGLKAFHGVISNKATVRDGSVRILDTYLKSGVGEQDEYYCREEYADDEAKGTAALLMAAAEIEEAIQAYTGD